MNQTTIPMPVDVERIAELIQQILAGKPMADIHEIWPVELVLRESTGPAPQ